MPNVDQAYAFYLQSDALYAVTAGAQAANYGDAAQDSSIMSSIALAADATTESTSQAAFLSGPIVRDIHTVKGRRKDLIGKVVTLINPRLGYAGGLAVFVVRAQEQDSGNTTQLYVLRRQT